MKKQYLLLTGLVIVALSFEIISYIPSSTKNQPAGLITSKAIVKNNISKTGKEKRANHFTKLYNKSIPLFSPLDNEDLLPLPTERLSNALKNQKRLLKYAKDKTYYTDDDLTITKKNLNKTVQLLEKWSGTNGEIALGDMFETFLLKGRDKKGNVKFTGYYSPMIEVSDVQTEEYQFPIYGKPNSDNWDGNLPTRQEIKNGALNGKGLELAWTKNYSDIRDLQLQGSGYVKYPSGKVEYFMYGGTNGRTTSNSMPVKKVNMSPSEDSVATQKPHKPTYIFFNRVQKSMPIGAGSVPLTPEVSVAVDHRLIPLGACLFSRNASN